MWKEVRLEELRYSVLWFELYVLCFELYVESHRKAFDKPSAYDSKETLFWQDEPFLGENITDHCLPISLVRRDSKRWL